MSISEGTTYTGQCFCGQVAYTIAGEPLFVQWCHCHLCRQMASKSHDPRDRVGYSQTAAVLTKCLSIEKGLEGLEETPKNNALIYSCGQCHSQIYGISKDPAQQEGIGINLNTINVPKPLPEAFKPIRHVYYANRIVMDIFDTLPKFVDMPVELGGSGKRILNEDP